MMMKGLYYKYGNQNNNVLILNSITYNVKK